MNENIWVNRDLRDKQRAESEVLRKRGGGRKKLGSSTERSVLSTEDIAQLKLALNRDLRNVSLDLSSSIDFSKYLLWFKNAVDKEDMHSCIDRSIRFLACDIDLAYEQGICSDVSKTPFVGSIYDAQDNIIKLYYKRVE